MDLNNGVTIAGELNSNSEKNKDKLSIKQRQQSNEKTKTHTKKQTQTTLSPNVRNNSLRCKDDIKWKSYLFV